MTAAQRRESIVTSLKQASGPVSASKLARELGVSRQIVVGDVALLRAAGTPVLATPRGYMLQTAPGADRMTVVCRHAQEALLDELYTIVDCGCGVLMCWSNIPYTVSYPVSCRSSAATMPIYSGRPCRPMPHSPCAA